MDTIKTANLIILNDEKNKILLFKRAKKDEESDKWSLVGGTLEKYESYEKALIREVFEEINCKIIKFNFFNEYKLDLVTSKYFIGEIKGEINLKLDELSEYKWFKFDSELLNLDFAFNQKEVIEDLLKLF